MFFAALPKILAFAVILIVGWFIASLIARGVASLLRAVRPIPSSSTHPTIVRRSPMAEEGIKPPSVPAPPTTRILQQGKRQFIIAPRRGSQALSVGLRPMPAAAVRAAIGQLPGLEVVRVLRSRRAISSYSLVPDEASEVYVVRIEDDRAELVKQTLPPQLLLEEDAVLRQLASDLARLRSQAESVTKDLDGFHRRAEAAQARKAQCPDADCLRNWYASRRKQLLAEF